MELRKDGERMISQYVHAKLSRSGRYQRGDGIIRFTTTIQSEVSAFRESEENRTARLVVPYILNGWFGPNQLRPVGWRRQS